MTGQRKKTRGESPHLSGSFMRIPTQFPLHPAPPVLEAGGVPFTPCTPSRSHSMQSWRGARESSFHHTCQSHARKNQLTSFLAWLAADPSRRSALYFASDSRVTFEDGSHRDDCIKLFCPKSSPDIFAMVGYIRFPDLALPTICSEIDQGLMPKELTTATGRIDWVSARLKAMKEAQPGGGTFMIFHASRDAYAELSTFALTRHRYASADGTWLREDYGLYKSDSHAIECDGSGGVVIRNSIGPVTFKIGEVSRAYFQAFCKALKNPSGDSASGGAPQLLGLGSVGVGRHYGVQTGSGEFFQGRPASFDGVPSGTQWRDEEFAQVGPKGRLMKNRDRKKIKGKKRPPKGS